MSLTIEDLRELGVPVEAFSHLADVHRIGTARRGIGAHPRGWLGSGKDYAAALRRHIAAWERGERFDGDSLAPVLAHIATNALILLATGSHPRAALRAVAQHQYNHPAIPQLISSPPPPPSPPPSPGPAPTAEPDPCPVCEDDRVTCPDCGAEGPRMHPSSWTWQTRRHDVAAGSRFEALQCVWCGHVYAVL